MTEPTITKADLARLLGVAPSSVTRWAQQKQLRTVKGRVPQSEADRLVAEFRSYAREHGDLLAGLDQLAEKLGKLHGLALRQAVDAAGEIVAAGEAYGARIAQGGGPEVHQELAATLRSRVAAVAAIHEELAQLEGLMALAPTLLPKTPRRALFEHAVTVGQMDPERARAVIEAMTEDDARAKLEELDELRRQGAGDLNATPAAGEE